MPTENAFDVTATPSMPVAGSRAAIENVPSRGVTGCGRMTASFGRQHPSIAGGRSGETVASGRIPAMKIAQIAPPWITVPPAGYGGTEWVVKHLCDGLVAAGHEVAPVRHRRLAHAGQAARALPDADARRHGMPAQSRLRRAPRGRRPRADRGAGDFDLVHDHSGFRSSPSAATSACRRRCTPCTAPSTPHAYRLLRAVPRRRSPSSRSATTSARWARPA